MCDIAEAMCKAQARWDEIAVPLCPHELKVRRGTATAVQPKGASCCADNALCLHSLKIHDIKGARGFSEVFRHGSEHSEVLETWQLGILVFLVAAHLLRPGNLCIFQALYHIFSLST